MTARYRIALALVLVVGTPPAASATPIACRIASEASGGFLDVAAVAQSAEAVSGRYLLTVEKHGASGRSRSVQAGAFRLADGDESRLTRVLIGVGSDTTFRAELRLLDDASGAVVCTSSSAGP